jgi:CBS domain containing-hemolysin-like protein
MPAVGVELVVILLRILANGVFAMAEIAVVSARRARLQEWADAGNPRARTALELAEHGPAPISVTCLAGFDPSLLVCLGVETASSQHSGLCPRHRWG